MGTHLEDMNFLFRWQEAAKEIAETVAMTEGRKPNRRANEKTRHQISALVEWTFKRMAQKGADGWLSPTGASLGAFNTPINPRAGLQYQSGAPRRICRLAFAVASGEKAEIPAREMEILKESLGWMDDYKDGFPNLSVRPVPPKASLAPGDSIVAQIAFPWRRIAVDRQNGPMLAKGIAAARITGVRGEDAPVAYRLAKPDGGWFDLRMIDGALHRPLLAPQSWNDATFGDVLHAFATGIAWRDHPGLTKYHPMEFEDLDAFAPDPGPLSLKEAKRMAEAAKDVATRSAGLVCVDGVVYMPCEEPKIALLIESADREKATNPTITWRVGRLTPDARMESLPIGASGPRHGFRWMTTNIVDEEIEFPLAMKDFADGVVARWRAMAGMPEAKTQRLCESLPAPAPAVIARAALHVLGGMPKGERPVTYRYGRPPTVEMASALKAPADNFKALASAFDKSAQKTRANLGVGKVEGTISDAEPVACLAIALCEEASATLRKPALELENDVEAIEEAFRP